MTTSCSSGSWADIGAPGLVRLVGGSVAGGVKGHYYGGTVQAKSEVDDHISLERTLIVT